MALRKFIFGGVFRAPVFWKELGSRAAAPAS